MKLLTGILALSLFALPLSAQESPLDGVWQGSVNVRGQAVPLTLRLSGPSTSLHAALLNGPASHPDESPANSVKFQGTHLVITFDYFARKLEATVDHNTLTGTFGTVSTNPQAAAPIPFTATRLSSTPTDPAAAPGAPDIRGSWEIATQSAKGENAWEFRVDPPTSGTPVIKAVIQRIDGDTGGLWGTWNGTSYTVSHFTPAGAAIYSITPKPDGTLLLSSLIPPLHGPPQEALIARRPAEARKENLAAPTDPTQQTTLKDPNEPLAFRFADLDGKMIANTDPRFQGKVVIVAIGGSWCPNCHDEAPFLVDLYNRFHAQGLEIVGLDFEQGDPDTDIPRLKAFIRHYNIPYPMLLAGNTDELAAKIPQGVNLNCWPTSFYIGRDGRVRVIHAGFAGPGNTAGHTALIEESTALVEKLLAEPVPQQSASVVR